MVTPLTRPGRPTLRPPGPSQWRRERTHRPDPRGLRRAHHRRPPVGRARRRARSPRRRVRHAPALSMVPHIDDAPLLEGTRSLLADPPDTVVVTTGHRVPRLDRGRRRGRARRAARADAARAPGSSRADPRRAARSRPPGSPPTGSPSPRRAPRSPRCCSTRASPAGTSPCSTTAPAPTVSTRRSPRPGAASAASIVYRWGPPPDPAVVDGVGPGGRRGRDRRGRLHVGTRRGARGSRPPTTAGVADADRARSPGAAAS